MDEDANFFRRHKVKVLLLINLVAFLVIDLAAGRFLIPRVKEQDLIWIIHPAHHHGFRPNSMAPVGYGGLDYMMFTNSLGFRDGAVREIPKKIPGPRILFLGDSFTEGVGLKYEETFVGRIDAQLESRGIDVLNAGAKSYCPKLYYLKIRHLIETEGLEFDELFLMLDSSDIPDELTYEDYEANSPQFTGARPFSFRGELYKYSFVYHSWMKWKLAKRGPITPVKPEGPDLLKTKEYADACLGLWTVREDLFEAFGKRGLQLAQENMLNLIELCASKNIRMTIGVYPNSNLAEFDDPQNSVQIRFWRAFAEEKGIGFVNFFPLFINEKSFEEIYATYFIQGDLHWNSEGHRVVADAIVEHLKARSRGE